MEAYFQGVWRMDWGFGNPNKTAALIATLMVAVWGLAWFRRGGFWIALGLFTALGVGLIRTMSRGGLVALCAGLAVLLWNLPRPWPKRRVGAVVLAFWVMVGAAILWAAHARYGQGLIETDRSITNRLELWKIAPRMMADAPEGWGLGNSGRAYMQWYQPTNRTEEYRTLVNSHLTWLVEFGWSLRFLYVLGWLAILLLCWPRATAWVSAIPSGIWVVFGVAAAFSSVAESPWLWILPGLALAFAVGWRAWKRQWPSAWAFGLTGAGAALVIGICFVLGVGRSEIRTEHGRVLLGRGEPSVWIVADERVLGQNFGKALRASRATAGGGVAVGIAGSSEALGDTNGKTMVLCGAATEGKAGRVKEAVAKAGRVILLSPSFFPSAIGWSDDQHRDRVEVIFGEFSQSAVLTAWESAASLRRVEGAGNYLSSWTNFVFAASR
ncbi:MAG: O-antigen ligase family protein [Verrucomicrobiae bacterium]|nr:O-antigen ligase family protein [Verrucomicrobiae bacterium]